MAVSPRLVRLLAGASIGEPTARKIGQSQAGMGLAGAQTRRRRLLEEGIKKGRIKPENLGSLDASLLGLKSAPKNLADNRGFRGVGGFFENLGSDIMSAGKHFVPGLYESSKAIATDLTKGGMISPITLLGRIAAGEGETADKVVEPTIKQYKQTYGQGNVLRNIYEHPLQPILDVATIASLGATGTAAAARSLAPGSRAARITSREGRSAVDLGNGVTVPRLYSSSPLTKARQVTTDKLLGERKPVKDYYLRRELRKQGAKGQAQEAQAVGRFISPLGDALKHLDDDELLALNLALRGVNTPERIAQFQGTVASGLEGHNPEGANFSDFENMGVTREYVERMAYLSPQVREMILDPSEAMVNAAARWSDDVARGREQLDIDDEIQTQALAKRDEAMGFDQIPGAANPAIRPDYIPDQLATGFRIKESPQLAQFMGASPTRVTRDKRDRESRTDAVTASNMLVPGNKRYLHESTGQTFMAGAFRTDRRALLDHTARREKDQVQEAYTRDLVNRYAARDEDGKQREFQTNTDVQRELGPDWTLVHPDFPIQWFRAETDMLERTLATIEELKKEGLDEFSPEAESALKQLQDTHAEAFMRANWGAMKRKGVAVPKSFFNYQKAIASVNDPFNNPFGNFYARWMHRWRTATLTYMPRWALNTAVGSFLLSMIRGVGPVSLYRGHQMRGQLPAGVELRSQNLQDYMEPGSIGGIGEARLPTRTILNFVQGIEDFFRRGNFIKTLPQEARQRWRDNADVMEGSMKEFYNDLDDRPLIEQWLDDPELVDRTIDEVNKFSYSFGELGPFERRYIRQFIPFWGWYKFITKFAWRLPFEHPARANVINNLSNIGQVNEEEYGLMPMWMRGSIILNTMSGGGLKTLSTQGLNPLASFANPMSPQGALGGGLAQLGQASPVVQAIMSAAGFDTLRGGVVPVSPENNVGRGFLNPLVSTETGEPINPASVGGLRRFAMGLLRSTPQIREGERWKAGGAVFPESVPFLDERPMPSTGDPESASP